MTLRTIYECPVQYKPITRVYHVAVNFSSSLSYNIKVTGINIYNFGKSESEDPLS